MGKKEPRRRSLLTAGADILAQLVSSIIENAPSIVTAALEAVTKFVSGITENLPKVLAKGGEILQSLIDGIFGTGNGEGGLLAQGTKVVTDIVSGIGGALPDILKAGGDIVAKLLSGIGDLPVIGLANRLLGAALGAAECAALFFVSYKLYEHFLQI